MQVSARLGGFVAIAMSLGCGVGDAGGKAGADADGSTVASADGSGADGSTATSGASGMTASSGASDDSGGGMDTGGVEPPRSGCEGKLEPVAARGHLVVVGDGSAASCTEDALHAAVAAVVAADGGGTVSFDCGGEHTITLAASVFAAGPVVIDGGGTITLSGGGAVRVIELDHYSDFVLQRITLRDGFVAAGSENESGAGLLHPWFGTLAVIDAHFENNHSESLATDVGGGAIYAGGLTEAVISGSTFVGNSGSIGGGVLSRSTNLRVVETAFVENTATSSGEGGQFGNGGGLYIDRMWLDAPVDFVICGGVFERNHAKVHGSAFFSYNLEGTGATFERCTFADNDMAGSPDGGTGTVYHEGVALRLVGSTFSGNTTGAHASGLFLGGGTDANVENCTFVYNATPGNAGALWAGDGAVGVTSSTFSGNEADYGPVFFKGESGSITLTSTILANNTTHNEFSALACHETLTDGGGNVQWPETKANGNADLPCTDGVVFADPQLAALADNGGPTPTMAIAAGSAAVDAGSTCPQTDQRGMPRVGACDVGAFELQ
jgi:hypothetical protein